MHFFTGSFNFYSSSLGKLKVSAKIEDQNCLYNLIESKRRLRSFLSLFLGEIPSMPRIVEEKILYCPANITLFIQIINKITLRIGGMK